MHKAKLIYNTYDTLFAIHVHRTEIALFFCIYLLQKTFIFLRLQLLTCAGVTAALVSYWGQTSNVICVIIYITAATCGALVGAYSVLDSDDQPKVERFSLQLALHSDSALKQLSFLGIYIHMCLLMGVY